MTRKNYRIIARVFHETECKLNSAMDACVYFDLMRAMAYALSRENSQFDQKRFFAACKGTKI